MKGTFVLERKGKKRVLVISVRISLNFQGVKISEKKSNKKGKR